MSAILESLFRALYAAYKVALAVFRAVDFLASVVVWATCYTLWAAVVILLVVVVQAMTIAGVRYCLFPPASINNAILRAAADYPVLGAFAIFAIGEAIVVLLVFYLFRALLTFELKYVFRSDQFTRKDADYTPFDDETTDASDPLTF